MKKRKKKHLHDIKIHSKIGEQPDWLEIKIGEGLIPLVTENNRPLLEQIDLCRFFFDDKYGLPLPSIRIRDYSDLNEMDFLISLYEVDVAKGCCDQKNQKELSLTPAEIIGVFIMKIIDRGKTVVLNQCIVNQLVEKSS